MIPDPAGNGWSVTDPPRQVLRVVRVRERSRAPGRPGAESRVATVVLALALVLAIAAYLAETRETSALRAERYRAAERVREMGGASLKLVPAPGLRLMHPWGAGATELRLPLGPAGAGGPADHYATSSFGKLGLVDSTGLRGTLRADENPSLGESALVLERLAAQITGQDPRVGPLDVWHGPAGGTPGGRRSAQPFSAGSLGTFALPGGMLTLVVYPLGPSGTLHEVAYSASMHSAAEGTARASSSPRPVTP